MDLGLKAPVRVDLRSREVLRASDVGGSGALWDLVRTATLVPLFGEAACLPEAFTPLLRAQSLQPYLPARVCVSGITALWVWTGLHQPTRIEITYYAPRRTPSRSWDRTIVRSRYSADQTVTLDGVQVFDPENTLRQNGSTLPKDDPALARLRLLSSAT